MKLPLKIAEMAVILITVVVMVAPLTGMADVASDTAAIEAQAEAAAAEIEKAFTETNPGDEIGKAIGDAMQSGDLAQQALLIPILGIIGVFIAPMAAIIIIALLAFRHRDRKEQRNHETIRQMIEKGMEIPPNISFGEAPESGSPLNKGLKYMGIGAGLIVFFVVMGMDSLAGIGAIPLFIGLAYLLISRLEKNKTEPGQAG